MSKSKLSTKIKDVPLVGDAAELYEIINNSISEAKAEIVLEDRVFKELTSMIKDPENKKLHDRAYEKAIRVLRGVK